MYKLYFLLLIGTIIASPLSNFDDTIVSFVETGSGLNVSTLTVNAGANRESKIKLGDGTSAYSLSVKGDTGDFQVRHLSQATLVLTRAGDIVVSGDLRSKGAFRIDGGVSFQGISQWMLAAVEDFNAGASGWSNDSVSICGNENKKILGGYGLFAAGEVSKTYYGIPPHSQVRLTANYHLIDNWGGETAYAKLERRVVWTDSFDQQSSKVGVSICGNPAPESKFSVPIDVVLPHSCTSSSSCTLTVTFGSTLTLAPTEQSWGVSDVMIYIR